jgi:cyanophycinase
MPDRSFAFLGAGEFEPWHEDVDRWLLERARGDGTVLVVPAASAPEGEGVFRSWADKGLAHYERLGVPAELLEVRTRDDALRDDVAERVGAASMVFVSGGNPAYLASVLTGTPLWDRIRSRLDEGLAYAGCSAGVACLIDPTFDSAVAEMERIWAPGLGHFPRILFAPHWDTVESWVPGAREFITRSAGDRVLIGLDEQTAMVGDGEGWTVYGQAGIHVFRDGVWTDHAPGGSFSLPLDEV